MGAEVLRQNGYSTAFFGKNHNVADWETSVVGAVRPLAEHAGVRSLLRLHRRRVEPVAARAVREHAAGRDAGPPGREGNYTLNEALADQAIAYIHQQKSVTPDRPFFVYYAPGATHAPHHAPKEWIDKFKGQFDQGWDSYREEMLRPAARAGRDPGRHQADATAG